MRADIFERVTSLVMGVIFAIVAGIMMLIDTYVLIKAAMFLLMAIMAIINFREAITGK